jgi:hypothetical protein
VPSASQIPNVNPVPLRRSRSQPEDLLHAAGPQAVEHQLHGDARAASG